MAKKAESKLPPQKQIFSKNHMKEGCLYVVLNPVRTTVALIAARRCRASRHQMGFECRLLFEVAGKYQNLSSFISSSENRHMNVILGSRAMVGLW